MADALRAKEQQRLEAKQAEWAQKKWVWVVDNREGCIPAHVVKEAGEDVTVKLNDGNVRAGRACAHSLLRPRSSMLAYMCAAPLTPPLAWVGRTLAGADGQQERD